MASRPKARKNRASRANLSALEVAMVVSDAEAKLVRDAYLAGGADAASQQLRQLFPGLVDNEETRGAAVTIVGWRVLEPQKCRLTIRR
jgi:hypothetical protein